MAKPVSGQWNHGHSYGNNQAKEGDNKSLHILWERTEKWADSLHGVGSFRWDTVLLISQTPRMQGFSPQRLEMLEDIHAASAK